MVRETAPWIPKLRKVREAQQSGGLSKRKGWPTPRAQESHKPHHTRRCEVFTLRHPSDSARSTAGECGICAVQPPFSSSRKMQVPERIHPYKVGHRRLVSDGLNSDGGSLTLGCGPAPGPNHGDSVIQVVHHMYSHLEVCKLALPTARAAVPTPTSCPYNPRFVFSSASNCSMRSSFSSAARRSSMSSAAISDLA